jgi:hypothetical protein
MLCAQRTLLRLSPGDLSLISLRSTFHRILLVISIFLQHSIAKVFILQFEQDFASTLRAKLPWMVYNHLIQRLGI